MLIRRAFTRWYMSPLGSRNRSVNSTPLNWEVGLKQIFLGLGKDSKEATGSITVYRIPCIQRWNATPWVRGVEGSWCASDKVEGKTRRADNIIQRLDMNVLLQGGNYERPRSQNAPSEATPVTREGRNVSIGRQYLSAKAPKMLRREDLQQRSLSWPPRPRLGSPSHFEAHNSRSTDTSMHRL